LHSAWILESLAESDVEGLSGLGEERMFSAGESVFRNYEAAHCLYILLEGRVKASVRDGNSEAVSIQYEAGDHFGRATLVDGRVCQVSVTGVTDGRVFVLSNMGCAALLARMSPLHRISREEAPSMPSSRAELALDRRFSSSAGGDLGSIRSISSAVAGVAHEINTPLGIIENAASLVSEQLSTLKSSDFPASPEAAEAISDVVVACQLIQKNVAHAARLVQSFKKLSVGQLAEPREQVDLMRLIHDVLNVFRARTLSALPPAMYRGPRGQSGQQRVALTSSRLDIVVSSTLPESTRIWDGFPGLFSRVLLNLLTNVDRYAYPSDTPGRVEIDLSRAELASNRRGFQLTVRDFGKGIAPTDLPHIFDPFFTTGRDKGGTGLGLAMVHNLVTQGFDGTIRVSSVLGVGTTFVLWFPESAPDHGLVSAEPQLSERAYSA
jgi:signal transduction histidine kinase